MRKTGYYEKGEGVSEGEKRGSCFIDCYAIGPDSADLVSFTNKGRALTHSQKTSTNTCTWRLWTFTHPLNLSLCAHALYPHTDTQTHFISYPASHSRHFCIIYIPEKDFCFIIYGSFSSLLFQHIGEKLRAASQSVALESDHDKTRRYLSLLHVGLSVCHVFQFRSHFE